LKYNAPCSEVASQDCTCKESAEELICKGYRNADDVRKETAKVILYILYDMGIDKETLKCCKIFDVNGVSLAKQICEKYDVEVERRLTILTQIQSITQEVKTGAKSDVSGIKSM
jgi:hypothetical protein